MPPGGTGGLVGDGLVLCAMAHHLCSLGPKTHFLELCEVGSEMGGPNVPQEVLSGLLVGLPAASSQDLLQMRRLKAAENRLMLWKEFLGSHAQL